MAKPARRADRTLDRILDHPQLAQVVPRLQPEVLHRVIEHYGLEACSELVALASPEQLTRVFDLDLWRPDRPSGDERFDDERFGVWLDVMVESGVDVAARTLAAIDARLTIGALAHHVQVFDYSAVAPYISLEGHESPGRSFGGALRREIGGYVVVARRVDHWDAITEVLNALVEAHHTYFTEVMQGCRRLSNSRPEIDGLDGLMMVDDQVMFDLAIDREGRRDTQGYVTPAEARAFLQMARGIDLGHGAACPPNPAAVAYFRGVENQATSTPSSAVASLPLRQTPRDVTEASTDAVVEVVDWLQEAGVLHRKPRALLDVPQGPAQLLPTLQACMRFAHDRNLAAFSMRTGELAYLANAIMAGSSVQSRPFTADEASTAAVAVCNLGLENWPARWLADGEQLSENFLVRHDLVDAFQVGWTILHQNVCMYSAEHLVNVLTSLRCDDRETQASIAALRVAMSKHWRAGTPWLARDALEAVAVLDLPAWAALRGLTGEFPVLHAALRASLSASASAIDPSAFEFISENRQIQVAHEFMRVLPDRLGTR